MTQLALLATRQQLVQVFGPQTGLHRAWFSNLADTPNLMRARKLVCHNTPNGGKESWYCPVEVMLWLVHSRRKRGRPLSEAAGYQLLKAHFPAAYRQHLRTLTPLATTMRSARSVPGDQVQRL